VVILTVAPDSDNNLDPQIAGFEKKLHGLGRFTSVVEPWMFTGMETIVDCHPGR